MKDRFDLIRRENVNCSTITVDEFVRMMFSDIIEAEEKYNDLYVPEYIANIIQRYNYTIDCYKKHAINFAKKKWKTQKKRNEWINKEVARASAEFNKNPYYSHLTFFDFDVHPESNRLSGNCCISINKMTFDTLRRCFNDVKDNYYFKNATGWVLEYRSSRPQIKLILPESVQNEYDTAADNLGKAINEFYRGCTYWGD